MAVVDINFQEGEGQDFIVEIPIGTSNPAVDILIEPKGTLLLLETAYPNFAGNIFIMSE